jgi:tetratricopeptide (TPR) repeat protein
MRRSTTPVIVVLATFLGALLAFALLATRDEGAARRVQAAAAQPDRSPEARIAALQTAARQDPRDAQARAALGDLYLQRVRETGDPAFYERADRVLADALRVAPRDAGALVQAGRLALARHDFRGALRLGERARAAAPQAVAPDGVLVDANVELGRYDEAARALQRMLDRKPSLPSYARASYLRELHGDLRGGAQAVALAVSAGGEAPENAAYAGTLLGDLELQRGRLAQAERAYRGALARLPGFAAAEAGLARAESARGDLPSAIRRLRAVVERLPLPEHAIALGEAELAAGRRAAARDDLALVRAEVRLLRAQGVDVDAELAVFEADHGSPAAALRLARRAFAAAPSVRSADALGWALTRAGRPDAGLTWARRALRLGSRDPRFLLHAGVAAARSGAPALARPWLRAAAASPALGPWQRSRARAALETVR